MKDQKARINPSRIALLVGLALAVPALAAETAKTGKAPGTAKKWFPGHYVMVPPDTYGTNNKGWRVLQGEDGRLFAGLHMYVTWGQIETTRDEWRWDKIDTLLNALPAGKKLSFSLSWQGWGGVQACPNDMLENPAYDGGQRVRGAKQASGRQLRSGVHFATIHMPSTMDRYLAFTKAFARLAAQLDAELKETLDPRLYGADPEIADTYVNVNPKNKMGEGNYPPPKQP